MSHRPRLRLNGLLTGALALSLALVVAPAAGATSASVRIVGETVGVEATVDTTPGLFGPDGCEGNSAGGAIDKAVNGNWDQKKFVQTILGETRDYLVDSSYWNFFINDQNAKVGVCEHLVSSGDRVLMFVQRDDGGGPTVFPLALSGAPASVSPGVAFTVVVRELLFDATATMPSPIAGATVAGGGASAQTDADGEATLTLRTPGQAVLRATYPGDVRSNAVTVAVTAPPLPGAAPPPPPPPSPLPPPPATAADHSPPATAILGIAEGQRFAAGAGPRELRVRVDPDPSGVLAVKLRLTRNDGGHCTYFSGKSERFRVNDHRGRCGARNGYWFAVARTGDIDYLLPSRLGRGRYVLDVNAIDTVYNRDDERRRGVNRIVFVVG